METDNQIDRDRDRDTEDQQRLIPPFAQRFLSKNTPLSISRSTPSLPDLVNYALSSATAGLSNKKQDSDADIRHGHSIQHSKKATSQQHTMEKQPRRNVLKKRRHSFTTFLNSKYGKKAIFDEDFVDAIKTTISTVADLHVDKTSKAASTGKQTKVHAGKKGHRPRSYSEITYNIPQVERAPPVAITNKTPAYEYYGFAMYLASFVAFFIYVIWAYVPDDILHNLGITYYPNRYWALAVPVWLVTLAWFVFISFMCLNLMHTETFVSLNCITDEHANLNLMDNELISDRPADWIPELHDIPINLVNKLLYQQE